MIKNEKWKMFLMSFTATIIVIIFVAGLAAVDVGSRGVAGYTTKENAVFTSTQNGLKITFLNRQYSITTPPFITYIVKYFNNTLNNIKCFFANMDGLYKLGEILKELLT